MKHAFTLMELQAALLIGIIVSGMAFLVLRYETERSVRVQNVSTLRSEAQKLDSVLQYLIEEGEVLECSDAEFYLLATGDRTFSWRHGEVLFDGLPFFHPNVEVELKAVTFENSDWILDLTFNSGWVEESYQFRYLMPSTLVVSK